MDVDKFSEWLAGLAAYSVVLAFVAQKLSERLLKAISPWLPAGWDGLVPIAVGILLAELLAWIGAPGLDAKRAIIVGIMAGLGGIALLGGQTGPAAQQK